MARLNGFLGNITDTLGAYLQAKAGFYIYVFRQGGNVASNSTGTTLTLRSGDGANFTNGDYVQLGTDSSTVRLISSGGGTDSLTLNSAVSAVAGQRVLNVGTVLPVSGDYDPHSSTNSGSLSTIYPEDNSASTAVANSKLTTDTDGDYSFYSTANSYDLLIQDSNKTNLRILAGINIGTVINVNIPVINITDYGAVGDGSTDDTAAIQAALTASTAGQVVYFPAPSVAYKITSALTTNTNGIQLLGQGGYGQSDALGIGSVRINCIGATAGFIFNPTAASTNFRGPYISGLHFVGDGSASQVGITIKRTNNYILENVICSDFDGANAIGIYSDGTGNVNQYGTYLNTSANKCTIGFKSLLTNGLRILGGQIDANDNGGIVGAGTTGIQHISGDTLQIHGLVMQYAATGFDIQAGNNHGFIDCRGEGMTTHYSFTGTQQSPHIIGGSYSNSIIGGTGTFCSIGASISDAWIQPGGVQSFATLVSDSGTRSSFLAGTQSVIRLGRTSAISSERLTVTAGSGVPDVITVHRAVSSNGTGVRINFSALDSINADTVFGAIVCNTLDITDGSEDGEIQIQEKVAGTLTTTTRFRDGGAIGIKDGITAPSTLAGYGLIYIDSSDGDLKIKFGDGTVKTIVVDT